MLERMQRLYSTPEKWARLVRILYWVSTLFTLLGFAVIAYLVVR